MFMSITRYAAGVSTPDSLSRINRSVSDSGTGGGYGVDEK
jgi:hypothetical protein